MLPTTPTLAIITVLTDDVPAMTRFYRDALGFSVELDFGEYIEFRSPGVRFALISRRFMAQAVSHASFSQPRSGQSFELAFPVSAPADVDGGYVELVARGAAPIQEPKDMPWGMREAFFADPDGNIHGLYANLEQPAY